MKQSAFLLPAISSRRLRRPFAPWLFQSYVRGAGLNCQKPSFLLLLKLLAFQQVQKAAGMSFSCRYGLFVRSNICASNSFEFEKPFNAHSWVDRLPSLRGNNARLSRFELNPI